MVLKRTGESMPGFRDFERTVAAVFKGQTWEDKGVLDVLIRDPSGHLPFALAPSGIVEQTMSHDVRVPRAGTEPGAQAKAGPSVSRSSARIAAQWRDQR